LRFTKLPSEAKYDDISLEGFSVPSKRFTPSVFATLFFVCLAGGAAFSQSSQAFESVIVQTPKPYSKIVADVRALGGVVTQQYKYVDAIAATVPSSAMDALRSAAGNARIAKDLTIPAPAPRAARNIKGGSTASIANLSQTAAAEPAAYALYNLGLNVAGLHARGYTGTGVVVAVIDSGVRPKYPVLDSDSSVIGGVDFVGDGLGFSNSNNSPHGTFIAGLISGNAVINLHHTTLETSLQEHVPGALAGSDLPLIGTAPASSIYAVRVFGVSASAGAPESRIIAAIDYVIDLRKKYQQGDPSGVNIQVCNLSLGNTTLFAGRDVFDRSVDALLANGIVPVVSAGDAGPSGLTVSSPATSLSSIAVGAISPAANDRVQADVENFPGYGRRYRPSSETQVAWFSARGPNADGRVSPDVVAVGVGNFGQGYGSTNEVSVVSGVSFSAPLVAGVAALLRQAYPTASATQIRNAIIGSGNPSVVGPGFTRLDQGSGLPDADFAFKKFTSFSNTLPSATAPQSSVATNIKQGTGLNVSNGNLVLSTGMLEPARRAEILYNVSPNTSQIVITVSDFKSSSNVSPQNIFPEEIYLQVHSAKTSQIGALGDYFNLGDPFIKGGTFVVNNPETGVMRITISGSWTNERAVSATVSVQAFTNSVPMLTTQGTILNHQQTAFPVTIPPGVGNAEFRLWFRNDWGTYPTSDIDMTLFDPNLNRNTDGAHLNDPEHATIVNPTPGTWFVVISGFDIPAGSDKYELRVTADGKVVK
jgi:serine protease AprX